MIFFLFKLMIPLFSVFINFILIIIFHRLNLFKIFYKLLISFIIGFFIIIFVFLISLNTISFILDILIYVFSSYVVLKIYMFSETSVRIRILFELHKNEFSSLSDIYKVYDEKIIYKKRIQRLLDSNIIGYNQNKNLFLKNKYIIVPIYIITFIRKFIFNYK